MSRLSNHAHEISLLNEIARNSGTMDMVYQNKKFAVLVAMLVSSSIAACGSDKNTERWPVNEPSVSVDMTSASEDMEAVCERPPIVEDVMAGEECEDNTDGICTPDGHLRCDNERWEKLGDCCDLRVPDIVAQDYRVDIISTTGQTSFESCWAEGGTTTLELEFVVSNEGNDDALVSCDLFIAWPIRPGSPYPNGLAEGVVWELPLRGMLETRIAPGEHIRHSSRIENVYSACPAFYQLSCEGANEPGPYVNICYDWRYDFVTKSWEEPEACSSGNSLVIHIDSETGDSR